MQEGDVHVKSVVRKVRDRKSTLINRLFVGNNLDEGKSQSYRIFLAYVNMRNGMYWEIEERKIGACLEVLGIIVGGDI